MRERERRSGVRDMLIGASIVLLIVLLGGLIYMLLANRSDDDTTAQAAEYRARVAQEMEPLLDENRDLSSRLTALEAVDTTDARADLRAAEAAFDAATRAQQARTPVVQTIIALDVPLSERVLLADIRRALDLEWRYLNAVIAVLRNPSPGNIARMRLMSDRLQAALRRFEVVVPGGADSVDGADVLAAWAPEVAANQEAPPPAPPPPAAVAGASSAPQVNTVRGTYCGQGIYVLPGEHCPDLDSGFGGTDDGCGAGCGGTDHDGNLGSQVQGNGGAAPCDAATGGCVNEVEPPPPVHTP